MLPWLQVSQFNQGNRSTIGKIIVIVGSRVVERNDFLLIFVGIRLPSHVEVDLYRQ
jgi:hypothetical protein